MLFPTFEFFVFFVITFVAYWYVFTKAKDRKVLLVIASFVFYSVHSFTFALLMFAFSLLNYFFGLVLKRIKNHNPRKIFLIITTCINILYLLYFKEAYNLIDLLNNLFPKLFTENSYLTLLAMTTFAPLGVSYYVFKCCSYIFDVYRGKTQARKSPIDVLLYVTFFPQVFSGPIVNASTFLDDLDASLSRDYNKYNFLEFDRASILIMLGLFKKIIVANFLSLLITNPIFAAPMHYNTLELIFASFACSIVIYADFSGYSDMAIGIGLLLGFETAPNFNRPYTAKSLTEFWRRWHISFSSWLRDYVYFSFGGSRFGLPRTLIALFCTMLIGGLWHGFKWTFLIWGALHGLVLGLERVLKNEEKANLNEFNSLYESIDLSSEKNFLSETTSEKQPPADDLNMKAKTYERSSKYTVGWKILQHTITFLFITITWIFFRAESLSEAGLFFASLKNFTTPFKVFNPFCLILLILSIALQFVPKTFCEKTFDIYCKIPLIFKALILATAFLLIRLFASSGVPEFIYFQF